MRFSIAAVLVTLAIGPQFTSAFAPGRTLIWGKTAVSSWTTSGSRLDEYGYPCSSCSAAPKQLETCACNSRRLGTTTLLRMAEGEVVVEEEPAAVEEESDVPPEVAALDGVLGDDEAHNVERPSRASLQKKTKKAAKPLSELEVGMTIESSRVKATTSYGAFLDIGYESDALLHVSRMADEFVSKVEDVVKPGDIVTVRVVSVDKGKGQVAVTMRSEEAEANASAPRDGGGGKRRQRPQRSAGDKEAQRASLMALAEKGYDDTLMVEGEVVNTLDFGAFVRFDTSQLGEGLEGELDGLVHISALSVGRAESVNSIVNVGDKVKVRVRNVDTDGNKISLSMISKEEEQQGGRRRDAGGDDGDRPRRRPQQRWTEEEMGAKDWKESLEKFVGESPKFKNIPVVVSKRK